MLLDADRSTGGRNYRLGYRDGKFEAYALGGLMLASPDATDCYSQGYRAGFAVALEEIKEIAPHALIWTEQKLYSTDLRAA